MPRWCPLNGRRPPCRPAPQRPPRQAMRCLTQVTAIVAQMTGYPADLLDPDLDLEADLGVDTVKQAEVFAAVRGHYQLERDANLKLRDFPTLRHVAGWVRERGGLGASPATGDAAPAAPTSAPAAALPAAAALDEGVDDVMARVTSIVAEMTGYPADLLEPDLDLEADLGVDTVKQAEVFAAVRGHYQLERDPNLKLRDFPTLRHVAGWVRERAGLGAAPAAGQTPAIAPAAEPTTPAPAAGADDDVMARVTAIVAEMTGYPADLLEPDLDLEADLGVDTVKQAEVFAAVRGHYQLERDPNLKLRDFPTLRHVAGWVRQRAGLGAAAPAAAPAAAAVATPAAAPAGAAAPASTASAEPSADEVMQRVTAIVAEMTGYPADLLEPDLDLEADLGVDTVKQAEVFAAVRGHYRLERDPDLKLRDFPTLRHVAGWVRQRAGQAGAAAASTAGPATAGASARIEHCHRCHRRGPGRPARRRHVAAARAGTVAAPAHRGLPAHRRDARRRPGGADGRRRRRGQGTGQTTRQGWAPPCWRCPPAWPTTNCWPAWRGGSRTGRSPACTGCRRWTPRASSPNSTRPPGTKPCAAA